MNFSEQALIRIEMWLGNASGLTLMWEQGGWSRICESSEYDG